MDVQLPDGTVIKGVPDGTTKAELAQKLQANGKAVPAEWLTANRPDPKGPIQKGAEAVGGALGDYGDAGLNLASGAAAPVVAGALGAGQAVSNLYQRAGHAIAPGLVPAPTHDAADTVASVEDSLTHKPTTVGSQAYVDTVTMPLRALAHGADVAGGKVAEVTGSPAIGAGVNTAIQALPALVEPGLRAARGATAEGAAAAAAKPTPAASAAADKATATARAADYARTRLGVDWDALSQSFKDTLSSIATDAKKLDALPVDAVKRQAQLQSLRTPVTTTAAKLSRDPVALRNEANVAATRAGQPIREADVETNRQLRANVEGLKQSVGGQGKSRATGGDEGTSAAAEGVGQSVQGAVRAKEAVSKANYNQLYKKARETNPDATTGTQAIQDLAKVNPAIQHLNWVPAWFKKAAQAAEHAGGTGKPPLEDLARELIGDKEGGIDQVKLSDLQDLREQAGGIARAGGTDGYHAGQVVKAIDKAMEEVPETAAAWKAAQKAFREHKEHFEETSAVERLVADKTKNDPKTAVEDTWKRSVQTAKLQEIRDLKKSLLSGGNEATRAAGKKALRELKQETVNQYLSYITRKTATNEVGETQITAVQMVEGLKHIGGEARVREILGNRAANELKRIIEAAKIAKTEPSIRNAGSSTLQNILAFAEKWIDKVPVVGDTAAGLVKAAGKVKDLGEEGRIARESRETPTSKPAAQASAAARRRRLQQQLKHAGSKVAPGAAQAQQNKMTLRDDSDVGGAP